MKLTLPQYREVKFLLRNNFLIIGMLACSVSFAQVREKLLDREISVSVKNLSFEKSLAQIARSANVKFLYSPDHIIVRELITLEVKNQTLRQVLDQLLLPRGIVYNVHEGAAEITIKRKTNSNLSTGMNTDNVSPVSISGSVTDGSTQLPMAGVSVVVRGTSNGTVTASDGSFVLEASDKDVIVFSFIGYVSSEVTVNDQSSLVIVLTPDVSELKVLIVNAGYYDVTDRERTGNITRVEAADIQKQPVSNPLAALQGRVPGLEIIQQSGVPGSNFQVRIRGTSSIANGNDPLYIIDGVPFTASSLSMTETSGSIAGPGGFSPLNTINPADIESIEVLKDADATAIYGSRGSNGVILITTKRGRKGGTQVDFNFYSGASVVASNLDLLSTKQYLAMRHEAFDNDGVIPSVTNAPDLLEWDTARYTDWQDVLIGGTAHTTDMQLTLSGGTDDTQFTVGAAMHKETTVFPGTNSDRRIAMHSALTHSAYNKKLHAMVKLMYSRNNTTLPRHDLTQKALTLAPVAPSAYDSTGEITWEGWSNNYENPLAYTKRIYESTSDNLIANSVLRYAILPDLQVSVNLGYTVMRNHAITTNPLSAQAPTSTGQSTTSFSNSSFDNWIAEPQLSWSPQFGHSSLEILAGSTFMSQQNEGLAQTGIGFSSEALMKNISAAEMLQLGTDYYSHYRYQAFFGRINYALKKKYILNLTARRDGSSRFGPGRQFATFGAVGAAWIFSNEKFMEPLSFLSFGKLRGSYGTTGNDQLGDYEYLDTYSSSGGPYQSSIGLMPDRLSNPDYAWETNRKLEFGIEFGFLKDRFVASLSLYRNQSTDQLVGYPLPMTTGFGSIQGNFPATVQNQGAELVISSINIQSGDFTWSTSFNISIPRNKLIEFPNLQAFPAYENRYVVGEPLSIRKVYKYTGIDSAGLYSFKDVNDDGIYNVLDRRTIITSGRKFFGGFQNTFSYKSIQLDIFFQFVRQTAAAYYVSFAAPGTLVNQPEWVMDRWQGEGDNTGIQRFGQSAEVTSAYERLMDSNLAITDASFIRLKNVSLSWSLPSPWLQKMRLQGARVFVQGQNLLTFTPYQGLDPETLSGSQLPPMRTITCGLHITL